ncbi:MAG TPA: phage tail protein [Candidatus Dormibacteraeota bacterium]|nr:phage tail protein [Candidatus Dormibacteraeota bacterium]
MPTGLPRLPSDALAGYHYSIEIDGVTIAQFQEVSGLTSEVDVIELKENTKDGKYVNHKLPGNRKPPSITLKRAKNSSKDLWDWHQKIYEGNVSDGRRNGSVVMYSYDHTEVGRYNFMNAWPSKVSTSTLKAGSNDILMEEVTIVCEELERVK